MMTQNFYRLIACVVYFLVGIGFLLVAALTPAHAIEMQDYYFVEDMVLGQPVLRNDGISNHDLLFPLTRKAMLTLINSPKLHSGFMTRHKVAGHIEPKTVKIENGELVLSMDDFTVRMSAAFKWTKKVKPGDTIIFIYDPQQKAYICLLAMNPKAKDLYYSTDEGQKMMDAYSSYQDR